MTSSTKIILLQVITAAFLFAIGSFIYSYKESPLDTFILFYVIPCTFGTAASALFALAANGIIDRWDNRKKLKVK